MTRFIHAALTYAEKLFYCRRGCVGVGFLTSAGLEAHYRIHHDGRTR